MTFQNSHVFGRQIQSILVALCDQFRPCGGWHGFSDWVNNFVQNVAASHDSLKNKNYLFNKYDIVWGGGSFVSSKILAR